MFLGIKKDGKSVWAGSGFLSSVEQGGRYHNYALSCAHVVRNAARDSDDGTVLIRTDLGREIQTTLDQWIVEDSLDVAALIVPELYQTKLNTTAFLRQQTIEQFGIGHGDATYTVGLYSRIPGAESNTPIMRAGIVAGIPDHPYQGAGIDGRRMEFDYTVVEAHSIGGLSGSPVFVVLQDHMLIEEWEPNRALTPNGGFLNAAFLLGMVHGHWRLSADVDPDYVDYSPSGPRVNEGLVVVIRAEQISRFLETNQRCQQARTQALERLHDKDHTATRD